MDKIRYLFFILIFSQIPFHQVWANNYAYQTEFSYAESQQKQLYNTQDSERFTLRYHFEEVKPANIPYAEAAFYSRAPDIFVTHEYFERQGRNFEESGFYSVTGFTHKEPDSSISFSLIYGYAKISNHLKNDSLTYKKEMDAVFTEFSVGYYFSQNTFISYNHSELEILNTDYNYTPPHSYNSLSEIDNHIHGKFLFPYGNSTTNIEMSAGSKRSRDHVEPDKVNEIYQISTYYYPNYSFGFGIMYENISGAKTRHRGKKNGFRLNYFITPSINFRASYEEFDHELENRDYETIRAELGIRF